MTMRIALLIGLGLMVLTIAIELHRTIHDYDDGKFHE